MIMLPGISHHKDHGDRRVKRLNRLSLVGKIRSRREGDPVRSRSEGEVWGQEGLYATVSIGICSPDDLPSSRVLFKLKRYRDTLGWSALGNVKNMCADSHQSSIPMSFFRRNSVILHCSRAAMRSSVARSLFNLCLQSSSISKPLLPVAQTI